MDEKQSEQPTIGRPELAEVKRLMETSLVADVNRLAKEGWFLIDAYFNGKINFVLGRK